MQDVVKRRLTHSPELESYRGLARAFRAALLSPCGDRRRRW